MNSHDAAETYEMVEEFESSDTDKEQKEGEEASEMVQEFESAHTDSELEEAINNVENFLKTCDNGHLLWETLKELRIMCVEKNLGQKFNEWRESYMQRMKQEDPTPRELWYSPFDTKEQLISIEWMQEKIKQRELPAITDEEVMRKAMGKLRPDLTYIC